MDDEIFPKDLPSPLQSPLAMGDDFSLSLDVSQSWEEQNNRSPQKQKSVERIGKDAAKITDAFLGELLNELGDVEG